jgi:hypothetical protein
MLAALGLAGLALSGCGFTGGHGSQVRQWANQNDYLANAKQVAADAYDFERAVHLGAALKMRTVCGGLSSDAGTLYSSLDTPDHTLTAEIARSMQDFFTAAEKCAVARSTRQSSVNEALAGVKAGAAELIVADHRMAGFGIHSGKLDKKVQLAWRYG